MPSKKETELLEKLKACTTKAYETTKPRWYKAREGSYSEDALGRAHVSDGLTLGDDGEHGPFDASLKDRDVVFLQERHLTVVGRKIKLIDGSDCGEVKIDYDERGTPTVTFVVSDAWDPNYSKSWPVRYIKDDSATVISPASDFFITKSTKDRWPGMVSCPFEIHSQFIRPSRLDETGTGQLTAVYHTSKRTFKPQGGPSQGPEALSWTMSHPAGSGYHPAPPITDESGYRHEMAVIQYSEPRSEASGPASYGSGAN